MIRRNIAKKWKDSATLILAARNDSHGNYNMLMLKRSPKSSFMPSTYVFPGGVISASDYSKEWENILKLNTTVLKRIISTNAPKPNIYTDYSANDGLPPELAFRLCALRETFEECGVLLVSDINGTKSVLADPRESIGGEYDTLGKWRAKVDEDPCNFIRLFRTLNAAPDVSSMYDWSTWLTPNFAKGSRFNTLFYICFLDNCPSFYVDDSEVVDAAWIQPKGIAKNLQINLPPPQRYELTRLSRFPTIHKLEKFAKERESKGLDLWCAYKINLLDGFIFTHPGDDFHNEDPNEKFADMKFTIEEMFAKSVNLNRAEIHSETGMMNIHCNVEWFGHLPLGSLFNVSKY